MYSDYKETFENAISGYNKLTLDKDAALKKLTKAMTIWVTALKESDPKNRKARINKKVTKYTHFSLVETYLWLNKFEKADDHLTKLYSLKLNNKEEKLIKQYRVFILDQKKRYLANNS